MFKPRIERLSKPIVIPVHFVKAKYPLTSRITILFNKRQGLRLNLYRYKGVICAPAGCFSPVITYAPILIGINLE